MIYIFSQEMSFYIVALVAVSFLTGYFLKNLLSSPSSPSYASILDTDLRGDLLVVVVVRKDIKMGKGKAAAQCSHGLLGLYAKVDKF